jgi:hypothetical protein
MIGQSETKERESLRVSAVGTYIKFHGHTPMPRVQYGMDMKHA